MRKKTEKTGHHNLPANNQKDWQAIERDIFKNQDGDLFPFTFPRFSRAMAQRAMLEPVIDVFQTKDDVVATVELPGVSKEDIGLKVSATQLLITVRKGMKEEKRGAGSYEFTARFEGHSHTIPLPARVHSSKAKATYKNGVLEVRVPKERGEESGGEVRID